MATGDFSNVYDDELRARAYSRLQFPGTYFLAYRDLPELIRRHVSGRQALDFGCGAGRSTRFLRELGFEVVGVDIAVRMLEMARTLDPEGNYELIRDGELSEWPASAYDLVFSAFTFDNVPGLDTKLSLLRSLGRLLRPQGRILSIVSAPAIYLHEWASFSTKDYPENRQAKSGDEVRIVITDVDDRRPVVDILCTEDDYDEAHRQAGLSVLQTHRPLGRACEPYAWVSETRVAPWVIYVLGRAG